MKNSRTIPMMILTIVISLSLACRLFGAVASPTSLPERTFVNSVEEPAIPKELTPAEEVEPAIEPVIIDTVEGPTAPEGPIPTAEVDTATEAVIVEPVEEPAALEAPAPAEKNDPATESDTPEAKLSGAACLVGTWEMDNASYKDFLNTLTTYSEIAGNLEYQEITGRAQATFTDDGMVSNQLDDLGFIACSAGDCMDFTIPPSDTTTYSYTTESETIHFEDGQMVAANFTAYGFSDSYGQTEHYHCSGDELTTEYEGFPPIRWTRVK